MESDARVTGVARQSGTEAGLAPPKSGRPCRLKGVVARRRTGGAARLYREAIAELTTLGPSAAWRGSFSGGWQRLRGLYVKLALDVDGGIESCQRAAGARQRGRRSLSQFPRCRELRGQERRASRAGSERGARGSPCANANCRCQPRQSPTCRCSARRAVPGAWPATTSFFRVFFRRCSSSHGPWATPYAIAADVWTCALSRLVLLVFVAWNAHPSASCPIACVAAHSFCPHWRSASRGHSQAAVAGAKRGIRRRCSCGLCGAYI